jgi:radical SAM/Cys-rich protein
MHATLPLLEQTDFPAIRRGKLETLQVNLGYRCNQQCLHCHVNAGPKRKENMTRETVEELLAFLRASDIKRLDLTGGAPELNPNFRYLVSEARKLDLHVIDRCNLTILFEAGQEGLAQFLADQQVEIVASLPCYLKENVEKQRGKGVFDASLAALKELNRLGYGHPGSGLLLNLMYNPQGPSLPPSQVELEQAYRQHLKDDYDIVFSNLYTLTNMPIQRFGSTLISRGQFEDYMQLLRDNFKQGNLADVMCRNLISVDWRGYLYDCDFNQMLDLPAPLSNKPRTHIHDLMGVDVEGKPIVVKDHCYGCTAGQGSSCGGAL